MITYLLAEDGSFLLAEDGSRLVSEPITPTPAISYTDTRILYNPRSKYSWFLYVNGQLLADITGLAENRTFSQTRNDSDQIAFQISLDKMNSLAKALHVNIADLFQANITELRIVRYGTVLLAGELLAWDNNVGADRRIKMKAAGWFDLLKNRLTSDSFVGTYSALTVVTQLITETLAKPYGTSGNYNGFHLGTVPSPDNTTTYSNPTFDNKTLHDVLVEFANDTNGFDFEVTWNKILNIYYPHIGSLRPDIVFTYPNGNVKDIQISVDGTNLVNSLKARGKGSGVDQLTVSLSDVVSQQIYGLREGIIDYTNISDITLLTNGAQADLNVYKQPLVIQKIMFDGSGRVNAPQVGTFHIGDQVKVYVNNLGLYSNIDQYYIIDKIEVNINEDDSEDVTITVGDPNLPANG